MRQLMIIACLAGAACTRPVPAPAPAPVPLPAAQADTAASPERRRTAFTQGYVADVAAETATVRAAGLSEEWDRLRPIVAEHFPPQVNPPPVDAADVPVIFQARIDRAVNFLLRTGYRTRHLADPRQARSIVRSAEITAWDDADALVRIAPMVAVARLDRTDRKPDNSADLVYVVTETIKGGPAVGTELRLQLTPPHVEVKGVDGAPPPPPPPNPRLDELKGYQSAVFFLQPAETVILPPGAPRPNQPAQLFGPMPISSGKVLPSYHSSTRETTVEAFRAAARAQQCSPGYVPVVAGMTVRC